MVGRWRQCCWYTSLFESCTGTAQWTCKHLWIQPNELLTNCKTQSTSVERTKKRLCGQDVDLIECHRVLGFAISSSHCCEQFLKEKSDKFLILLLAYTDVYKSYTNRVKNLFVSLRERCQIPPSYFKTQNTYPFIAGLSFLPRQI